MQSNGGSKLSLLVDFFAVRDPLAIFTLDCFIGFLLEKLTVHATSFKLLQNWVAETCLTSTSLGHVLNALVKSGFETDLKSLQEQEANR
jgi:hypothetical protein